MTGSHATKPALIRRLTELLLWSIVFFAAYAHRPLFTSNQVTKFLHGLAAAGHSHLNEDWLATTFNTFPPFTWLVYAIYKVHPYGFLAAMVPVCMVYLAGLLGVARAVGLDVVDARKRFAFLSLVVASHSAGVVQVIKVLTGIEEKGFPGGLAEQYLLGPIFQPNVFGVFIVLSVAAFAASRPIAAALLLAVAPVFHPTYLIGTAVILAVYLAALFVRRQWLAAAASAVLFALPIVPLLAFVSANLAPTSPEIQARAHEILAHSRIEHHSAPSLLDPITLGKGIVCAFAVALSWRTVVGWVLIAGLAVGGGLTVLTVVTGSDTLALVAPWRVSVWIVPIALAVLLAQGIRWLFDHPHAPSPLRRRGLWAALVVVAVASGVVVQVSIYAGFHALPWIGAMRYAREHRAAGQQYLVPPDLAEFRVQAGVPTLVTWKSHPIRDVEVLAWYDRVTAAEAFYVASGEEKLAKLREVVERYGVTHVLVPRQQDDEVRAAGELVYEDEHYAILRVR